MKISIIALTFLIIIPTITAGKGIDKYIDFSPNGYEDLERIVTRNGTVLESTVPDNTEHLKITFLKNSGIYEVHIIYFNNPFMLLNFWYTFVNDYSNGLTATFSAIPFLYGEFNKEYMKMQLSAWYRGFQNMFFTVYGPKRSVVNDLILQLNRW